MPNRLDFDAAVPPDTLTDPCSNYFEDWHRLARLRGFVDALVVMAEHTPTPATPPQPLKDGDTDAYEWSMDAIQQGGGAANLLRVHNQMLLQLEFCRSVDNYLVYLSELFALVFKTVPEMLRSKKTVTHEQILEHLTLDELMAAISDKRVQDLAYLGMDGLAREIEDAPFRFKLFEQNDDLRRAIQIVEVRNLIVHNRAIVNNLIVSRLPDLGLNVGDPLELEYDQLWSDILFLAGSVADIDKRASQKWGLPPRPK